MLKKLLIISISILTCNISFGAKYFAEVNQSNVVKRVIVADSKEWCEIHLGGSWIETFMDAQVKNYAGKGHDYYVIYQDFIAPTPYTSWVLTKTGKRKWVAPIPMPTDGEFYVWDESLVNWKQSTLAIK